MQQHLPTVCQCLVLFVKSIANCTKLIYTLRVVLFITNDLRYIFIFIFFVLLLQLPFRCKKLLLVCVKLINLFLQHTAVLNK